MKTLGLTLPKTTGRVSHFDELKGIAMVLLLLYHAGGTLVWNNHLHGDLGTDIFFLVSGLCLALNAHRMKPGEFITRRLMRVLPGYWIVLTAYVLLNTHFLQFNYSALNLALHYLGLHALGGDGYAFAVADAMWFITAILCFYGAFLLTRRLLVRLDVFLLAAAVASTAGVLLLFWTNQSGLTGRWGFRMIDFFAGMIIGQGLRRGRLDVPLTPTLALALFVLAYVPYTQGIAFHTGAVALLVMGVFVFGLRPWLERRAAGESLLRASAFVGRHSLEIFLIHQPLMRDYNRYLHGRWFNEPAPNDVQLIMGIIASVAVTLVLAVELRRLTNWLAKFVAARLPWLRQRVKAPVAIEEESIAERPVTPLSMEP